MINQNRHSGRSQAQLPDHPAYSEQRTTSLVDHKYNIHSLPGEGCLLKYSFNNT